MIGKALVLIYWGFGLLLGVQRWGCRVGTNCMLQAGVHIFVKAVILERIRELEMLFAIVDPNLYVQLTGVRNPLT
jgi:hypothetical protein